MTRAVLVGLGLLVAGCNDAKHHISCPGDPACPINADIDAGTTDDAGAVGVGQCSSLHITGQTVTPSIELLLDRSGSMADKLGNVTRYAAMADAVTGTAGFVTLFQSQLAIGATVFSDDQLCPTLASAPRALDNAAAIAALIAAHAPAGSTPTDVAITAMVTDFEASPPAAGHPPVIALVTDGTPTQCGTPQDTSAKAIVAAQAAYAQGVRLGVIALAPTAQTADFFQALANAGTGVQPGQPNAPYYPIAAGAQIINALKAITGSVQPCDLTLDAPIPAASGPTGTVTLNGTALTYSTDWTLDADGVTLHVLGAACTTLKTSVTPTLDAMFACAAAHT
jgi:hypothetical protein